jgi:hypothetical protein
MRYRDVYMPWGYAGAALLTYQAAFGITLRWFERRPHIRLYLGPLKLYAGLEA